MSIICQHTVWRRETVRRPELNATSAFWVNESTRIDTVFDIVTSNKTLSKVHIEPRRRRAVSILKGVREFSRYGSGHVVRRIYFGVLLSLILATPPAHAFQSPVETPALPSTLSAHSPLLGVARAGQRIVAVGLRGNVVLSDDDGRTWRQASVPVSEDLVAVSFPTPKQGWAVGHGGVIIHTSDGGATWVRQMDGRRLSALAVSYYQAIASSRPSAEVERAYEQAKALSTDGSTQAMLDVYFESSTTGYVVGAFNRIFRTEDGGETWTPWMERTNNPREFHFYSVRGESGHIVLTGEQGMVWVLNQAHQIFEPKPTTYKGTLFGSLRSGDNSFVYGMRGSLFRSADNGKTWEKIGLPSEAGITGGISLGNGGVLLVNQAGIALISRDGGKSFHSVVLSRPMSYFGVSEDPDGKVALVGSEGIRVERLPQPLGRKPAAQN
ncbi:hypothetical protein DIE23_32550 [Burkholderia sp. Bp9143]|nr:hypothetical protein DIE23_32550 [Burkholderia sp. Bp9143]